MNPATTLPGWSVLRAPLMTPASISGTTPSGHISLCTPRSLWLERRASTALGMPPIPTCSVAPSGISAATCSAMRACTSVGGSAWSSTSGRQVGTMAVIWLRCRNVSPIARGMRSFISATTMRARRAAVSVQSAPTPRLTPRWRPEPVGGGRAHLRERDVNRQLALEKPFNLAQADRRVIATALRHRFANVAAQKQAVVPEVAGVFRPQVGQRAQCQHLAHFDVPQLGCASHQRFQQHDRDAAPLLHPDPIARVNQFDRALSAGNPLFIIR